MQMHRIAPSLSPHRLLKIRYREQHEKAMAVKSLKHATTPLEKERLLQQRIKERRAAAKALASGASRSAASSSMLEAGARRDGAADSATRAVPDSVNSSSGAASSATMSKDANAAMVDWDPPASHGGFERLPTFAASGHRATDDTSSDGIHDTSCDAYDAFHSPILHRAWRHCVGVRGRKVGNHFCDTIKHSSAP